MVEDAKSFIEEELADQRTTATEYYMGRPFGDEEEGRSQVVSTDVRDIALRMEPQLMRVFHGPEHAVEFRPRLKLLPPEGLAILKAQAEQLTDYVSYIYNEDNEGFEITQDVIRDAEVRKIGFARWWWDESQVVEETEYTGLTEQQLTDLTTNNPPGVEVSFDVTERVQTQGGERLNARIKLTDTSGRVRVESIPPEEMLWNRNATAIRQGEARLVCHDREVMVSDLVALGYDPDDVQEHADVGTHDYADNERMARRFDEQTYTHEQLQDPSLLPVQFCEAYTMLDKDGDGQATLYKVDLVGKSRKLLSRDGEDPIVPVSHLPVAAFHFNREPHTVAGLSVYDMGGDLQRINSQLLRQTLDSASLSNFPRMAFQEGRVNLADLMNTEIGALIRTQAPPSQVLQEVKHSFIGGDTLPMLEKTERIAEERFGVVRASAGLNTGDLQSSTDTAVRRTFGAREARTELVARGLANGFKQMFAGIARTVIEHQERARVVELRGSYVEVNPKAWNAAMDVRVNVGLGAGLVEDRIATLQQIAGDQTAIISQLGPTNPVTDISQLVNTRRRIVELAGFSNPDEFYHEISEQQLDAMRQAEQDQSDAPSDPVALEQAKAETIRNQMALEKSRADLELQQQRLEFDRQRAILEDDRERDKAAADLSVRMAIAEAQFNVKIEKDKVDAATRVLRARIDSATRQEVARIQKAPGDERTDD